MMSTSKNDEWVTTSLAPSHILQDGRFIHLPQASEREQRQFFERSIARHNLLQEDLGQRRADDDDDKEEKEPKVHPLALASAQLQSNGINELNRAINLGGLVVSGEYFGMSNIVDPSMIDVAAAAAATSTNTPTKTKEGTSETTGRPDSAAVTPAPISNEAAADLLDQQKIKATFVMKRKRTAFQQASNVMERHYNRLLAAVIAQRRPDERFRQLRPHWRIVAPEHGTRAAPHAARPTETVACDVDVYFRTGAKLGRRTSRVPRYATMEFKEAYSVEKDIQKWKQTIGGEGDMDIDDSLPDGEDQEQSGMVAVPFMIADPTLGKIDADFDPKNVSKLSLQFDIEKSSTGFRQSVILEPFSSASSSGDTSNELDEKVLYELQHSLFCAKMFESMRRELAPDTEEVGNVQTSAKVQSVVWLLGESQTNFLPPPSLMIGDCDSGLPPLCVVHCHEGEVKVQLDCEYHLTVKLVEAQPFGRLDAEANTNVLSSVDSGSRSPAELLALCRAIMLHGQDTYHRHSMDAAETIRKQEEEEASNPSVNPRKRTPISSPRVLQSCVSLGAKMLFERRIRKTLVNVKIWLSSIVPQPGDSLQVEWLPVSVFDMHAQFVVSFRQWLVDVHLDCEELTVTSFSSAGDYRKVRFRSDSEFELYLKTSLHRVLKEQ